MATRLKPVDVVLVGMGFTGAILARELGEEGLSIVGLERGKRQDTVPDWQSPAMHDELRYAIRNETFQNAAVETFTFRNHQGEEALPIRLLGAFLPGSGLGGAGVHWNARVFRFLPSELRMRSHYTERYGAQAIPDELTIQDWGITWDEIEPQYDRFEHLCGVGGKAGNLKGEIQPG
ncbi:MAG TPA: GMC family oxidoreductase, partial [Microvirga sp.]|nr:GMC family oxidoreductase [Microvirga sp.]